jgi:hypothetical protein
MLHRAILAAILITASTEASAETHMVGAASQSCETWMANAPTSGAGLGLLLQQWIFGFVSGDSFADPDHDPLNSADATAITTFVNDYCQNNATARIGEAAAAFVRAHRH